MKLCIDCRFYGLRTAASDGKPNIPPIGANSACTHPSVGEISPVDGRPDTSTPAARAYVQRQYPHWFAVVTGHCGTRARFFEAKVAD